MPASHASPLHELHAAGQAIWLDYIDRTMLEDGELARRIREDALTGMTSNPSIFEKAMATGTAYDAQIAAAPDDLTAWELFELIETDDVRTACDEFLPLYEGSEGAHGFASIEVSPGAAHDARATIEEAHRLWKTVDRPNVMIKVPGTPEGALALRQLTADGLNVNVTLLFAVQAHDRIIEAYLSGLEERVKAGRGISHIASVASFFVSRVDTAVDKTIDEGVAAGTIAHDRANALRGLAAIANARRAYRLFRERFAGARWAALAAKGGRLQRPLWASTSTKNPAYRDVLYVEQLIGPDTVNTMTPSTIEAFRDHGVVARTVDVDLEQADRLVDDLRTVGIDLDDVTSQLLVDGIASFEKSFDTLLKGIGKKATELGRTVTAAR